MEYLNDNIIETANKREPILQEILMTESVININTETFNQCFNQLLKFLENYACKETTEYVTYLLFITINIRPKSRKLIATLIQKLFIKSNFRESYFDKYSSVMSVPVSFK